MKYLSILLWATFIFSNCTPKASPEYIAELSKHRMEYKEGFKNNDRAPLRTDVELSLMDFFDADESFRCPCSLTEDTSRPIIEMATYAGTKKNFKTYGTATCKVGNEEFSIVLYTHAQYDDHPIYSKQLFVPFKDLTSGETTYGGGRYMDLSTNDIKDNILTIDFNHCYNPWCVYSSGYSCPVPPKENHIPIAIKAGEKLYKGEYKEKQ